MGNTKVLYQIVKELAGCYLGSNISRLGNCEKRCTLRIGKASSVFGRLVNIWKSNSISLPVKVKLYESLVISTLLYGTELWPLPVTQMKKLEATHHKFQRRLLGITRKDQVRNEEIRKKTGLQELIIKERRLRWLGHVLRMENSRIPRQAIQWELRGYKRKLGRPRKNWMDMSDKI